MTNNITPHAPLLICIGNDYRGDDGVGLYIGRHAKIKGLNVQVIENSGDGIAMMDTWKERGTVILVDAVYSGHPAGTIFRFDALNSSFPENMLPVSTHDVGIAECISLSDSLDLLPKKMIFYGIGGENFGQGKHLSAVVRKAADAVVGKIAEELANELLQTG